MTHYCVQYVTDSLATLTVTVMVTVIVIVLNGHHPYAAQQPHNLRFMVISLKRALLILVCMDAVGSTLEDRPAPWSMAPDLTFAG